MLLRAVALLFSLTGLCAWSGEALAIAKYARVTGNWGTAGTWSTNPDCTTAGATTVPTAADAVTICPGVTVTVNVNAVALSVDVQNTGTLTQTGARSLTISGPLNVAGTYTCGNTLSVAGATTVSGLLTISATTGTKAFTGDVTINGGTWSETAAEAIAFGGNLQNNGTLTASTGVHTFSGAAKTFSGNPIAIPSVAVTGTYTNNMTLTVATALSGGGTLTNGVNQTLNLGGTTTITTLDASASPNIVNYNGAGNQTIKLPSAGYHHLTLSTGGTKAAPAGTLNIGGDLTVNAGPTFTAITNDPTINVIGNVTIDGIYTASNLARPLTIGGNMSVGGTYTGNVAPVNLAGDFTRTGTFTSGTGVFTFNGSALQTLTGASTFTNMTVNNSGTGQQLALASDITVSTAAAGGLILTQGNIATGANSLIIARACNVSATVPVDRSSPTAGWVAGNLRLAFPTGAPSCTFHVGDASAYRPINMTFASVTTAGSLTGTVSQTAGDHGSIASSGLDSAKDVNRYWTLTNPGGIVFTTYTATFNFINPGDIDVDATPTSFEIERWDGSAWNNTTLGTAGSTSTSASGLPPIIGSNDFAVGEKKGPYVVSIVLASPDPTSPATLVDWTVTFSAGVTGVDATDFALVPGGSVTGAAITGVNFVSGATWTVTASTGAGAGTLGLNLVDDDTIVNAASKPLGGAGAGNGNFTGQAYTVIYTASGFVFTNNSACVHNIAFGAPGQTCAQVNWSLPPQIAGQNLMGIYITAVNTSGVPTRLHASQDRTRNMEFGLSCHNPVANAGVQATFAGVTLPLCQANGAIPGAWTFPVTVVTFPGGSPSSNVSYTFNYADVGSVELWMRNSAIPTETGNSGAFVVKPAGFVLSNIKCTTVDAANCGAGALAMPTPGDNPGAANAAGVTFIRAGHPFSATVTATTIDGVTPTPNYGKETTPENVKLTSALSAGLGLTINPAVGGTFGAFANGVATGAAFTWNEAGIITLTPSVGDGDYLGAGNVTGTASSNVGRFYAAKFALTKGAIGNRADLGITGSITAGTGALTLASAAGVKAGDVISISGAGVAGAAFVTTVAAVSMDGLTVTLAANVDTTVTNSPVYVGSFTYMGEQINAMFTLTAQAIDGTPLQNYNWSATPANQFAKLNPMAAVASGTGGPLGMGAVDSAATRTPFPPCGITPAHPCVTPVQATAGTFVSGVANVTVPLTIYRDNAAAAGPYALLDIGVAPVDDDGVMAAYDLDTDATLGNDHTKVARTEVRYGRMKITNAHGSELLPLPIAVAAQYWNGTAYVTNTLDNNSTFAAANVVLSNPQKNLALNETSVVTPPASVVFTGGVAGYRLAKPSGGDGQYDGSVDMTVSIISAYLPNTTARATFGVYKGNNQFIYLREMY